MELTEIRKCLKQRRATVTEPANSVLGRFMDIKKRFGDVRFLKPLFVFSVLFGVLALGGNSTILFYGPTIFSSLKIGIDPTILAILPWIGFALGYAGKYVSF